MNVESLIKEQATHLKNSRRAVEIAPDINKSRISKIQKKYSAILSKDIGDYILAMSYSGTGYFFMTGDTFYFDNFMQGGLQAVRFADISSVRAEPGNSFFKTDKIYFNTTDRNYVLDGCIDGLNLTTITAVFNRIIAVAKNQSNDSFTTSKQGELSSQLPEKFKQIYLMILSNYAYLNDSMISPDEYNAITKISIRMEVNDETRIALRKYMNNPENRIKTGTLLAAIIKNTENHTGWRDAIKYCMMQDALYIHEIQNPGKRWEEDGFIGSLMERCSLVPDQINTMNQAISLNKEMQQKNADMDKLKKKWNTLIKSIKDTPGYVPSLYLFCSGSVYMKETYEGFFGKKTSQEEINKQRELILHDVIINNQKTVNVLIGDMNYLAERLEQALDREDVLQQKYALIRQLMSRIKAASQTVEHVEQVQQEMHSTSEDGHQRSLHRESGSKKEKLKD